MIPPTAATSPVDASPVSDAPDAPAPRRVGSGDPDRRRLSLLVASHGVDDFYQGAIPALVPFLTAAHALTFAQAGGLVFAVNVLSSVLQPLLGWWADRRSRPWLIALGLVCVSSGIALAVLAPTYRLALAALVLTGIGVAAYHPEATRAVHHAAGAKRGTAMSLFALGGNLGFALGPVLVVPVATAFGMRAVAWLALPAFAVAALMLARAPRRRAAHVQSPATVARVTSASRAPMHDDGATPRDDWSAFALLSLLVLARAITYVALTTFLAAWWSTTHRTGTGGGGIALTVLLWSGLVGTLCGGPLADRIGRRRVIAAALALATPCLVATFLAGDAPWTLPLLGLGGAFLFAPFSVMVVLGQEYLPRHLGTAAGMTLGMALTVGGIAAPLLGALADRRGVQAMLLAVSWIPLLAALLAVRLPDPASHRG